MIEKELICIGCPFGCQLYVNDDGEKIIVSGNNCSRGYHYAKDEIKMPVRVVTSTMNVLYGERVSCKTERAVNKNKVFDIMNEIKKHSATAPIKIGDVLIENVCKTGINVIATKNVDKNYR